MPSSRRISSIPVCARTSVVNLRSLRTHWPSVRSMPGSFWGPTTTSAMVAMTASSDSEIPNTAERYLLAGSLAIGHRERGEVLRRRGRLRLQPNGVGERQRHDAGGVHVGERPLAGRQYHDKGLGVTR